MSYYRIRPHWRETGVKTPPATEAIRVVVPVGSVAHIDIFELESPFVEYIRRLNGTDLNSRAWHLISSPNAGIFNYTRKPDGTPDIEWYQNGRKPFFNTVAFDGNVVNVLELDDFGALIETISVNTYVPLYTYFDRPDLVHQYTSVNKQGRLYKAGNAITVYSPLLTRTPSWLPLEILEPFPQLPVDVTVQWTAGLNVRKLPNAGGSKVTSLEPGTQVTLLDYQPRGSEVWGRIQQGYVCLYTQSQKPAYSTNWMMTTHSPPL